MRIMKGTVRNGVIELDGEPPPDGTPVIVAISDVDAAVGLTPEEAAEFEARIAEPERAGIEDVAGVLAYLRGQQGGVANP